jgi:hypothetical protein
MRGQVSKNFQITWALEILGFPGSVQAGRDAGCFHSMSFCAAKTHKPKNGMDAIALGRQGGRLFPL